ELGDDYWSSLGVMWIDGEIVELPTFAPGDPLGWDAFAYDLNELGDGVGEARVEWSGDFHAVVWRDGTIIDLQQPPDGPESSFAGSINNLGEIVGSMATREGYLAMLWVDDQQINLNERDRKSTRLNSSHVKI